MASETVVCFDIGGVLVQICHTWEDACRSAGVGSPPPGGPHGLNDFEPMLLYQAGHMEAETYLHRLADWLGTDRDGAERVHQAILCGDYPGALALVEELKGLGVFTCCFSNTNALHWPILSSPVYHPAVGNLDERFASHELKMAKPDVEAYRFVESRMPAHGTVVFFEDGLDNVIGAAEAGWQAFRIDPSDDPVAQARTTLRGLGLLAQGSGAATG